MYMESPLLSRGLQATSTPSLGAGSHRDLGSHQDTLDVSGINGIVMDDEVFEEADKGVNGEVEAPQSSLCETGQDLPAGAGADLRDSRSNNSLADHTPLRSNCSRGSNKSGGPVKSLFLPSGEVSTRANTNKTGQSEVNCGDNDFSQDITVNVQCICGSNFVTESQLIQCVHCLHYLHTDCVNLGDSAIAEVEQGLDWFCPACRNLTGSDGTSLFIPTPTRHQNVQDSASPKKPLASDDKSYSEEPDVKKKDEEKQKSTVGRGAKLSSGCETPLLLNPSLETSMFDSHHQSVASCSSPPPHSSSLAPASHTPSSSAVADCTPSPRKSGAGQQDSMVPSPSSSQNHMQSLGKEQQDSAMVPSPRMSQESMQQIASKEQLDCTADVLAFALKQDEMSPLPFTSSHHQGFASNRQYSTASNDESSMAFSPKPSHNLAQSASKEQLDCTADVLALAPKLGEMSPLPFLKPRTTLFRKPKAQVLIGILYSIVQYCRVSYLTGPAP